MIVTNEKLQINMEDIFKNEWGNTLEMTESGNTGS